MLNGVWSKLTAPTTRYEVGNLKNAKEARAADRVAEMESTVRDIGVNMAALDETPADKNSGNKGNIYTEVGLCKLGENGQVVEANVFGKDGLYEVKTKGDHKEIHRTKLIHGTPSIYDMSGDNTLEQHEWAIFDGQRVTHKTYDFFSDRNGY